VERNALKNGTGDFCAGQLFALPCTLRRDELFRPKEESSMKKWMTWIALGAALSSIAGCKSGPAASTSDEAKMRSNFTKTGFDINDVPPEQRERVKAIMAAQKKQPQKGQ
jgi:hypothetical protein